VLSCAAITWAQAVFYFADIREPFRTLRVSLCPGRNIKATQTATGLVRTAVCGGDGTTYSRTCLSGLICLEVRKDGFSGVTRKLASCSRVDTIRRSTSACASDQLAIRFKWRLARGWSRPEPRA